MVGRQLLAIISICALLAACGTPSPRTVEVREQNAGDAVALRRGDQLVVALEGNPTTGYTWEQVAGDATIVKLTGEPAFKPDSQALGAGGLVTFQLAAVGAGQTKLTFIYHRSFEPNVAPLKTFTVSVGVT